MDKLNVEKSFTNIKDITNLLQGQCATVRKQKYRKIVSLPHQSSSLQVEDDNIYFILQVSIMQS